MPTASDTQTTLGEQFKRNPNVRNAISAIVDELRAAQASITDVRPARSPELAQAYEKLLEDAGEIRGRALLYPYLGSGMGNGALVELADGSVKFDMISGIGVHFFGHSDPLLVQAALEGAAGGDTIMQGHLQANHDAYEFARVLLDQAMKGSRLAHVFLCNSGVMANENALKICYQKHAPASRVIAFGGCFMGRSVTMAQIGDSAAGREGIPLSTLVDYMPFYDHAAAKRMSSGDVSGSTRYIDMCVWHLRQYIERYPKQHACFIFELVQGEGGFNTAPPEYFRALMEVCKDAGIAVWDDEVQTFGRTTEMFCYDALGLGDMIDVVCVGKMSQVCAVLYTSEYNPRAGLLSATFLGSTDAVRAGRSVIERLRDNGHYGPDGKHAKHFKLFEQRARALAQRHPDWFPPNPDVHDIVSGHGGMMRLTPFGGKKDAVTRLCRTLFDEGVITFYCGHNPYHLRLLPPLGVMQESQWDRVFELIESGMAKVASTLKH